MKVKSQGKKKYGNEAKRRRESKLNKFGQLIDASFNITPHFRNLKNFLKRCVTDGSTDGPTDQRTDGWTDPLIAMRGHI